MGVGLASARSTEGRPRLDRRRSPILEIVICYQREKRSKHAYERLRDKSRVGAARMKRGREALECRRYGPSDSPASMRSSSWRQFPILWLLFAEAGGSLRSVLAKHSRYLTRSGSLSSTTLLDSIVETLARPVGSEEVSARATGFGRPY